MDGCCYTKGHTFTAVVYLQSNLVNKEPLAIPSFTSTFFRIPLVPDAVENARKTVTTDTLQSVGTGPPRTQGTADLVCWHGNPGIC